MKSGTHFTDKSEAIDLAKTAAKIWIYDFAVCRKFDKYFVRELSQAYNGRETIIAKVVNNELVEIN